ncbi:HNH endonuclease [Agromyces humi]|uniref:HNH endonuclease n=1 Tax=Agromyces humi TaxID=1766800 RepID=UPI001F1E4418|nr:HNH endonuclease [Agromyces humi]
MTAAVVVLNASFEPLGIVSLHRAMAFLLKERAVIVEAVPGQTVRSATAEYPFPRVVQFREMVRVPYKYGVQPWTREGVLQRDRGLGCAYCTKPARPTTIDHIMPKSRFVGNPNTWLNTIAAHTECNGRKADRTPLEAGMPLRYQPREVTTRDTLLVAMAEVGADLVALGLA